MKQRFPAAGKPDGTGQFAADADFLRIAASFFVVLIHAAASFQDADGAFAASIAWNAVSRFSVPVFVMLSGRFLLAKKPDAGFCLKKALRTFAALLFWGTVYLLYAMAAGDFHPVSLSDALWHILTKPVHLWYFYAAIALYLFTPPLAVFAENAEKTLFFYTLCLTFFFGSLIMTLLQTAYAESISIILEKMKLDCTLGFIWCYLFGRYVFRFESKERVSHYLLGALGTAVTFTGTLFLSRRSGMPDYRLLSFFAPNVLASGAAVYLGAKAFFRKSPPGPRMAQGLRRIARCTPGVYGIHVLFLDILPVHLLSTTLAPAIAIPLTAMVVYLCSLLLISLLRHAPLLNKLL